MFPTFSNTVSTHIRGHGHAVFQLRDGLFELKTQSSDEAAIGKSWITRTRLVAEGLSDQPYIHLDIRTPFGESVDETQVDGALAESLGARRERYGKGGWHIQFIEDTNLGSNHRVFLDLKDLKDSAGTQVGMDAALPLEVAVEALAEAVLPRCSEPNFQLLVGGSECCYSVLYVGGSPFHVLRVREAAGEKVAARLAKHREFAQSQGKGGPFRTYLCPGDPLAACEAVRALSPEIVDFGLGPAGDPAAKANKGPAKGAAAGAQDAEAGAGARNGDGIPLYLHLGLALAASKREYADHNRVLREGRLRNRNVRGRSRFAAAMVVTALLCGLAAGAYALAIRFSQSEAMRLSAKATAYQAQVEAIRELRSERLRLFGSLAGLKPLWSGPIPWGEVFADLEAALPAQSGVDGLQVARGAEGALALSFRAWVKDWDAVGRIERKLSESRFLEEVSISEQRKDLASGAVVFHVSCRLRP